MEIKHGDETVLLCCGDKFIVDILNTCGYSHKQIFNVDSEKYHGKEAAILDSK